MEVSFGVIVGGVRSMSVKQFRFYQSEVPNSRVRLSFFPQLRFFAVLALLALWSVQAAAQCYVYVPTHKSNSVAIIRTGTNQVEYVVPVQVQPLAAAAMPNPSFPGYSNIVYVTNSGWFLGSNSVSVIDLNSGNGTTGPAVVATIPVGRFPIGVAFTPNGAFAYVVNDGDNSVSVIDTTLRAVVATIGVGASPWGVRFTPDGAYAYVTNQASNDVSVINTATKVVAATVPVGNNPDGLAVTPDGAFVYVENYLSNSVSVISTATNSVVNTIAVGTRPIDIAILPNGASAYVVNDGDNDVSVINIATNGVTGTISVQSNPRGIAISPAGGFAYVSNRVSNTLSVIDTNTNSVAATVSGVALFPEGVAVAGIQSGDGCG
jgi:YVTN family beta-propeller protein